MKAFILMMIGITAGSMAYGDTLEQRVEKLEQNWSAVQNSFAYPKDVYLVAAGTSQYNNVSDCDGITRGTFFLVFQKNQLATVVTKHECKAENYLLIKVQGDPSSADQFYTVPESGVQKLN